MLTGNPRLQPLFRSIFLLGLAGLYVASAAPARASTTTIAGQVTYALTAGFPDSGRWHVALSSNPNPQGGGANPFVVAEATFAATPFNFKFTNIPDGAYYVSAWRDVNGNNAIDYAEPWGAYSDQGDANWLTNRWPAAVYCSGGTRYAGGQIRTTFNIVAADFGAGKFGKFQGTINYSGTRTGTLWVREKMITGGGDNKTLAYSSFTWANGQTSQAYQLLVPGNDSPTNRVQAFFGSDPDHRDFQLPLSKADTDKVGTFFGAPGTTINLDLTLVDAGALNTTKNATITGTARYSGAQSGKNLVVLVMAQPPGDDSNSEDVFFKNTTAGTVINGGDTNWSISVNGEPPVDNAKMWTGEYWVIVGVDFNGDGLVDGGEPYAMVQPGGVMGPILKTDFVGGTKNTGTTNISDQTNSGQITGTVYLASSTPNTGTLVVKIEKQWEGGGGGGGGDGINTSTVAIIPMTGAASYNFTLTRLGSATNYYLTAFYETDGDARFQQGQSTGSSGNTVSPYFIAEPFGSYGQRNCNGPCVLTQPIAIATGPAATLWPGLTNTCGANHATACPNSATLPAGPFAFELTIPPSQPPAAPTLTATAQDTDKINWTWTDPAGENGFRAVDASSNPLEADQFPHVTAYLFSNGFANTPYTAAVVAFNTNGNSTSTFVTRYTLAATPVHLPGVSLGTATSAGMQVQWSSGTQVAFNPVGSRYGITLSTVNAAGSLTTPVAATAFAASSNVVSFAVGSATAPIASEIDTTKIPTAVAAWGGAYAPNALYYAYVNAINGDNIQTSYIQVGQASSPPNPPATVASTFTAVSSMTLTAYWSANGNAQDTTVYRVVLSPVNALPNSATYPAGAPAGDVAAFTTPIGPNPSWTTPGSSLVPNTSYYLFVQSTGSALGSPFVALGSTSTLAVDPSTTTPVTAAVVTASSMTVTFDTGKVTSTPGNPIGTLYRVFLTTAPAFSTAALSYAGSSAIVSTAPTSLPLWAAVNWAGFAYSPNATYFGYVQAVNMKGTATSWVQVGSGTSPPALPVVTAAPISAVASTGTLTVNWNANGNAGGTQYNVLLSTWSTAVLADADTGKVVYNFTTPAGASVGGLLPDTTWYLYVQALGGGGLNSTYVAMGSTFTLAAVPATIGFAPLVTGTAMTVEWASGTAAGGYNPLNTTRYSVVLSTVNSTAAFVGAAGNMVAVTTVPVSGRQPTATVAWAANQVPNGLYYAYVNAINHTNLPTAFAQVGSAQGPPAVPAAAAVTFPVVNSTGTLSFAWLPNGNPANSSYTIILATFTGASDLTGGFGLQAKALVSTAPYGATLSATIGGLLADTTYFCYIQGANPINPALDTLFLNAGSTFTLAAQPGDAGFQPLSSPSNVTVVWSSGSTAIGYNPLNTTRYSLVLSTQTTVPNFLLNLTDATNVSLSTTPAGPAPMATIPWGAAYKPGGTYYAYVKAINHGGLSTSYTQQALNFLAPPATPVAAGTTFTAISTYTLTVAYAANNNAAGTTYLIVLDTVPALGAAYLNANGVIDTDKLSYAAAANIPTLASDSGKLSVYGLSTALSQTLGGAYLKQLYPNTTYYLHVQAIGGTFINATTIPAGMASTVLDLGGVATLANVPVTAGVGSTVSATGMDVTWLPGTTAAYNLLNTQPYTVVLSTQATLANYLLNTTDSSNITLSTTPVGPRPEATVPWGTTYKSGAVYYAYVKAVNFGGTSTTFSPAAVGQGNAPPAAPTAVAASFPLVASTGAITVAWADLVNAAGQTYSVILSTVTGTFGAPVADSTGLTAPSLSRVIASTTPSGALQAVAGGLQANTTYFLYVQTKGVGGAPDSPFVTLAATSTLAGLPAATPTAFPATMSSVLYTMGWASGTAATGYNPSGSTYTIILSTVNVPGNGVAAAQVASVGATSVFRAGPVGVAPSAPVPLTSNVLPNVTYYAYVSAINNNGIPTAYVNIGSTSTLAAQPASAASTFTVVNISSVVVAWSANGNPPTSYNNYATTYTIVISTVSTIFYGGVSAAGRVTVAVATQPAGTVVTTLTPDTIYYGYVNSTNLNSVQTAYTPLGYVATLAWAPATVGTPFSAVVATQAAISWSINGNPADSPYVVFFSTVSSVVAGATAAAGNVGLSTAPSAATPVVTVTGLAPTTTYYAYAGAINPDGIYSVFTLLGSTRTRANAPIGASATGVGLSSFTANWTANGNAAGTLYTVTVSTDFFVTPVASSQTANRFATFTGLASGINHYVKVVALSYDGGASVPTPLPTVTTAGGLAAPAALPFDQVDTNKIRANWSASAGAARYAVAMSTAADFGTLSITSNTANTQVVFGFGGEGPSLDTNKLYYVMVQATGTTASPFTVLGSTYTLAKPPTGSNAASVFATSATIAWGLNGNPALTTAVVIRSTMATFAPIQTSSAGYFGATPTFTAADLSGCTPYWFKARNANGSGILTDWDTTVVNFTTQGTTPTAPGSFGAEPSTSSYQASLSWYGSASEGVVRYNLYKNDGAGGALPAAGTTPWAIYYATWTTVDSATGKFAALTPIVAAGNYAFRLNAVHRCATEETMGALAYSSIISTTSLAAARANVTSPDSGANIVGGNGGTNSLTVMAAATAGSPSFVALQYKAAGGDWIWFSSATTVPYTGYLNVTTALTVNQSYQLRAVAYKADGSSDTFASAITINVIEKLTTAQLVVQLPTGYVLENVTPQGVVTKTEVLQNGTTNSMSCGTGGMVVDFVAPPGVFGSSVSAVAVTISPNPPAGTLPPSPAGVRMIESVYRLGAARPQATVTPSGLATEISVLGGVATTLSVPATIKLSYGNLPAGMSPSNVVFYVSHAGEAFHLEPTTLVTEAVDTANAKVVAKTTQLSFFAGFGTVGAAAADLSAVRVYPVPYKPSSGNPDEGGGGIIFDRVPADVTIKIFTLSGRQVANFNTTASAGSILWDTRNTDGRNTASGGYLAVISSPGLKSIVKKLVIIR